MKFLKIALLLILISCTATLETAEKEITMTTENEKLTDTGNQKAYFAGGCFWCMEPPFEALEGVLGATSGYMGGTMENPTYEDVVTGETGHAEVVEILYDPNIVTYEELLEVFWRNIDPTALNYQFADVGSQYRTEIFTVGTIGKYSLFLIPAKIVYVPFSSKNPINSCSGMYTSPYIPASAITG